MSWTIGFWTEAVLARFNPRRTYGKSYTTINISIRTCTSINISISINLSFRRRQRHRQLCFRLHCSRMCPKSEPAIHPSTELDLECLPTPDMVLGYFILV